VRREKGPSSLRGVGLRARHYGHVLEHGVTGADFVEIVSENFFAPSWGGRPWAALLRARRDVPVALHGVSLGIGNVDPLSDSYLGSLAHVIERLDPFIVSDHLCWTSFGGKNSHELLPMPYTEESLAHVIARVHAVQERLGRTILLENISRYVDFRASTMDEADFLNAIAVRTGCGVLLDVNNVYVTSRNLGTPPETFIETIEHVRQFHLAGFSDEGTILIDTHSAPVSDPVWALYDRAKARFEAPVLLEWDAKIPSWDELTREAARA
jgi:uncharacterized protein (UPF0276 family)